MNVDQIKTGFGGKKNNRKNYSGRTDENRTVFAVEDEEKDSYTADMDSHQKLFRKILMGRAYQIMMISDVIKYKPLARLEKDNYRPVDMGGDEGTSVTKPDKHNDETVTCNLRNTYARIGRFFDTISKEATMIRDDGENVWFDEIARMTRIEREAVEAKRRQIEIKARGEQDERFKQVMEIHQEISKLVSDRLTDHVIDEYANEVAVTLLKNAIADQNNTRRDDEHIEQDLQEFLMHSANTT